jgi:diacylglycerol kinase (ATP)
MFGVLVVELLNSSIEALTDLVTDEYHFLAKKAKDCGSAAVLISLISCFVAWCFALYTWYQSGR